MDFRQQQAIFDDVKWYDSIVAGEDRCGTYDFCVECDKGQTYPCARAAFRHQKGYVRIAVIYKTQRKK